LQTQDYIQGPDDAPVTISLYGDFQCVLCARYARDLEELRARYPADLRLVWRHFPATPDNDKSALAFQAAEAAAAQGNFWDMYAVLFANQPRWLPLDAEAFQRELNIYAALIGLDTQQFSDDLASGRFLPLIPHYQAEAAELDIVGIPTLLINGEPLNDRDDLYGLDAAFRLARLSSRHFEEPPPFTLDPELDYQAILETEKGTIRIDLLEENAPLTVNNFVFLAQQGWYNGNTFFLVIPEFFAQTGDPSDTGRGYPGYTIESERDNDLRFDRAGMVAMAAYRGDTERTGSQFFITLDTLPNHEAEWDGFYTIFGQVMEGIDVLQNLTERNEGDPLRFPAPPPGVQIWTVTIETMQKD
jgi:cyclophilin family peptidyl-prolyl cis-trans isomerase/predicted DsbA family dithiol-disulfide isomerase